ncbi:hypothetical protein [Methanoregula sp.]|nr:hypothetical protein [Methanoregula sp.]HVP96862.1 hypothetical protein [Methanoregula sp.]
MEEKAPSALMNYYLRRVIARIVVPRPVRVTRAQGRREHRPR